PAAPPVSMMNSARARNVNAPSPSTATATPASALGPAPLAIETEYVGRLPVYNLRVEGSPEFFANGVLVHNCDALRYAVRMLRQVWLPWVQREEVQRKLELLPHQIA